MKYIFNFENREKPVRYNREKLLLSALQKTEQLYYMMDTQYEGLYQAEAVERKRFYGGNTFGKMLSSSSFRFQAGREEAIREAFVRLSGQKTSVFRRGMHFYSETEAENLVPGDVVFLSAGDVVPSDLRIVFSKDLVVDQSIYTGDTHPVPKTSDYGEADVAATDVTDLPDICFVGTTVVSGLARGVVVSTGAATYLSHLLSM